MLFVITFYKDCKETMDVWIEVFVFMNVCICLYIYVCVDMWICGDIYIYIYI